MMDVAERSDRVRWAAGEDDVGPEARWEDVMRDLAPDQLDGSLREQRGRRAVSEAVVEHEEAPQAEVAPAAPEAEVAPAKAELSIVKKIGHRITHRITQRIAQEREAELRKQRNQREAELRNQRIAQRISRPAAEAATEKAAAEKTAAEKAAAEKAAAEKAAA